MIEKSSSSNSTLQTKKEKIFESDQLNIFNEINLNYLFTNEEIEKLMQESTFCNNQNIKDEEVLSQISSEENGKSTNNFDRMSLIMKFLSLSIEKLIVHKEGVVAKGLEWVRSEIQDSLIFKSDEKTLKHLEQLKEGNQDIQLILNWMQEYSTLNANQNIRNNLQNPNNAHIGKVTIHKKSFFSSYLSNDHSTYEGNSLREINSILKLNSLNKVNNTFLNFSEESVVSIDQQNFDIFQLEKSIGKENTLPTISCFIFLEMGLYSLINYSNFETFVELIRKGYNRKNSYHTDLHAADVEQTCYLFFKYGNLKDTMKLNDLDCAAFMISAIIHDFKHPGFTNNFLINSKNEISLRYNDQSVLENYHVSEAFHIIHSKPDANIFAELSLEEYKVMRKRIVDCVLATDMTLHNKEYSYFKLKMETFNIIEGKNTEKIFENLDNIGLFNTQQEFLNTFIHTADIANPTKALHIYEKWVVLVMDEFWMQGDTEKEMKLPVSFLCDRLTTKVPASQLGFMDGIVFPLVQIVVGFLPGLKFMIENLNQNKAHFKKLKEEGEASH